MGAGDNTLPYLRLFSFIYHFLLYPSLSFILPTDSTSVRFWSWFLPFSGHLGSFRWLGFFIREVSSLPATSWVCSWGTANRIGNENLVVP